MELDRSRVSERNIIVKKLALLIVLIALGAGCHLQIKP